MPIKRRAVYAPTHNPPRIDFAAELAKSDAARAEEARVAEQATRRAEAFLASANPLQGIVERLTAIELRLSALESVQGVR